jgi:hypothetical protein
MLRTRTRALTLVLAVLALVAAGCGADDGATAESDSPATSAASVAGSATTEPPADDGAPLALVVIDDGLAAVPVGSSSPRWSAPGGVAALDGSAVFAATRREEAAEVDTELTRLDPRTGAERESWDLQGPLAVAAVAPGGRWVALVHRPDVDHYDDASGGHGLSGSHTKAPRKGPDDLATRLVVFDGREGRVAYDHELDGDVLPEAFSSDGTKLFTLRFHPDHYRIETVDVATGAQDETLGRNKKGAGEMHGSVVRAVMSQDGSIVSTLYRNPGDAEHPAFVHVLDVLNGWAHCADLPAPFGGEDGTDDIFPSGYAVDVVHRAADGKGAVVANVNVDALHNPDPETPIAVTVNADADPPTLPAGVTEVDGFAHLVTVIE